MMLEIVEQSAGALVGLRVSGRLTSKDLERAIAYVDQAHRESGQPIRLVVEIPELAGAELKALWQDLKYSLAHQKDFERVAVVSDQSWIGWWTRFSGAITRAQVRHFRRDDLDRAWAWVRE